MTILDEREPTISLKLIIALVSLVTVAAFTCLFVMNTAKSADATNSAGGAPGQVLTPKAPASTGNI
jgi:hypothetical protein